MARSNVFGPKHQYYSARVFVKEVYDGMLERRIEESSHKNLRKSLKTHQWEILRPQWVFLVPWLSRIFSEKCRRYAWSPLDYKLGETVAAEIKAGRKPDVILSNRLDAPLPEEKKTSKFFSWRQSYLGPFN